MKEVVKPIGLHNAVRVIENLCATCIPYENTKISPLLIELDAGNGQTTFTRYATQMLIKHKIRQVVGCKTYLEFEVDSRKDRMQVMFGEIIHETIGVNYYESVIAMDVTVLCECLYEEQTDYFLKRIQKVSEHAVVLLYLSPSKAKYDTKYAGLKKKLEDKIADLQIIEIEPYTMEEFVKMIMCKIDDYGIDVEDEDLLRECIEQIVECRKITCVKEALWIAETIVKQAKFNKFFAVLDVAGIIKSFPEVTVRG